MQNENSAHSFTEGSDSGTLKFSNPAVKAETKHTPGPWSYRRTHEMSADHWYVIVDSNGNGPIVDVGGKDLSGQIAEAKYLVTDPKEIEANARLIASAPQLAKENKELKAIKDELLALLESAKTVIEVLSTDNDTVLIKQMESAINKAKAQ